MKYCSHTRVRTVATYCYSGPVSREQNPAAHGNITDTDECLDCGARRA